MTSNGEGQLKPCERVLLVDDDPDILEAMRDVLETGGVRVEAARSAREADRVLEGGFAPSVIVVDVRLGGEERGDAYASRLRRSARTASVPVVLMSADLQALRRHEREVDATLPKPFELERLFGTLSDMCGEHAARLAAAPVS